MEYRGKQRPRHVWDADLVGSIQRRRSERVGRRVQLRGAAIDDARVRAVLLDMRCSACSAAATVPASLAVESCTLGASTSVTHAFRPASTHAAATRLAAALLTTLTAARSARFTAAPTTLCAAHLSTAQHATGITTLRAALFHGIVGCGPLCGRNRGQDG
jgi:hypothetical protein